MPTNLPTEPHGDRCEVEPHLDEFDRQIQALVLAGRTNERIGEELSYTGEWVHKRIGRILEHLRACTGDDTITRRVDFSRALSALAGRPARVTGRRPPLGR